MSREWKPGDVALVSPKLNPSARCISVRRREGWACEHRGSMSDAETVSARPLVVIDPEDRESVGRVLSSLQGMSFSAHACGAFTCLQAALREFADPTPPKPDEPQGLGAVVEDEDGNTWVSRGPGYMWTWVRANRDGVGGSASWEDIAAVRVLSEGWRA